MLSINWDNNRYRLNYRCNNHWMGRNTKIHTKMINKAEIDGNGNTGQKIFNGMEVRISISAD